MKSIHHHLLVLGWCVTGMGTGTAPIVAIIAKIPILGWGAPEPPRPGGSSPENCICVFVYLSLYLYLREHARLDTTGAIHFTLRSEGR